MSDLQPKIALVIGVNGGSETGLAPLRYAEETAHQVASVLASPVCNFKLHGGGPLLGEAATTDAVRRAIFDARRAAGQHGTLLLSATGGMSPTTMATATYTWSPPISAPTMRTTIRTHTSQWSGCRKRCCAITLLTGC
ncbi:hypothetical protein, partial [Chloroflexus sp.]|uniref:hypothetical protein n=1 Tax=Chloroflexus sp. TaxID=1904827 RepID=UPI00404B5AD2